MNVSQVNGISFFPFQPGFVILFQTCPSDIISRTVFRVFFQKRGIGFNDVSQQVPANWRRVIPHTSCLHGKSGKTVGPFQETRVLLVAYLAKKDNRLVSYGPASGIYTGKHFIHFFTRQPENGTESGGVKRFQFARSDHNVVCRLVPHHDVVVAVIDQTA